MPLEIPSHQSRDERNSSIQQQLSAQGFGLPGKPLLRDSEQAKETMCPGLVELGKRRNSGWLPPEEQEFLLSLPAEGRVVWCRAWEMRKGLLLILKTIFFLGKSLLD